MARYRYYICDVFTETRFGGNQLAVLPAASGLTDRQMQQVAREFNFPESTFVFPSSTHTRRVRIFTPAIEMPFAGHPNIGTAFVLAETGELGPATEVVFDEKAGPVTITIQRRDGRTWCELTAPQSLQLGETVSPELLAEAIGLAPADIVTTTHEPRVASVGFPFLFGELQNREALARARSNPVGLDALVARKIAPDIHLYVRSGDEFDLRARMFMPLDGIPEDPATGSANCALAALLATCDPADAGDFTFRIAQGVEMGRPSVLHARASKRAGVVAPPRIGGTCVMVSEGTIEVDG